MLVNFFFAVCVHRYCYVDIYIELKLTAGTLNRSHGFNEMSKIQISPMQIIILSVNSFWG